MSRQRVLLVTAALALTALAVLGVMGSSSWSGPVLITFSSTHGLHRDDLFVLAAWAIGIGALVALWGRKR